MSSSRRPSIYPHHSSTGSVHSSNGGSFGYPSPQSLPPGPEAYRRPSHTAHHMTSYGEPRQMNHPSPPQYFHQQEPLMEQPTQPYQQLFSQPSGQQFGFGAQSSSQQQQHQQRYPPQPAAPSRQFAAWGGYSGFSAGDNTLDEEEAVPPESNS